MTTKAFKYDETARRKPVNLTVNQDLLASARKYKLNLSKILEDSLITELKTRWQNDWLDENKAAISAYNKRIAKHGVFSDGIRRF
jgi:antitoxin CcdA